MTHPTFLMRLLAATALVLGLTGTQAADMHATMDTARIEQLTGLKGTYSREENVFKVGKPRNDVKIQVDNWEMPPFMGLGSWAAFTPAGNGQVMLMGDTALFEDEVNPVMSAALDAGIEVNALHNHFFFDKPRVYFMHIGGTGSLDKLASGVKKMYGKIDEIRKAAPVPASGFPGAIARTSKISAAPLEAIFRARGLTSNGMFKVILGRHATMHGTAIGREMGVNTWAAFAGSDGEAVVDGDIVMTGEELQAVLKSLRGSGINIVAIHQHMVGEQPPLYFLHYWGKGSAPKLAQAVKKAISNTQLE